MSTDLIERRDAGYKLTSFYGGDARGVCLQITALNGDGFIQLDRGGADLLIQDVRHLFLEKQDEAQAELKAAEKRLVKTETELVEARRVNSQFAFGPYELQEFEKAPRGYLTWLTKTLPDFEEGSLMRLTAEEVARRCADLLLPVPGR